MLALATFDDDEVLAGVLRAGAAGFVLKDVPAEDLHRAVRVVAGGGAWLDPAVTGRVLAIYRSALVTRHKMARAAGPAAASEGPGHPASRSRVSSASLQVLMHPRRMTTLADGVPDEELRFPWLTESAGRTGHFESRTQASYVSRAARVQLASARR